RHAARGAGGRRGELAALLRSGGTFHVVGGGRFALGVVGHGLPARGNVSAGRTAEFASHAEIRILEPGRARPRQHLVIRVEEADLAPFIEASVLDAAGRIRAGVPSRLVARRCCAGAYLRGAFLAHGSVANPRSPVHLEVRLPDAKTADDVVALVQRIGAAARVREHRGAHAVYAKDGATVGRVLAAIGAHAGYLEWEQGSVW